MKRRHIPLLLRLAAAVAGLLWLAACATVPLDAAAPLPSSLRRAGASTPQLAQGRLLYVTRCAKCHQVYPVRNYTAAQWEPIMASMAVDAKLDAAEEAAVRTYVAEVLKSPG